MCGFIQRVSDSPAVKALLLDLGMNNLVFNSGDFVPGSQVDIALADPQLRAIRTTWWFLIGSDGKPNYTYSTFNARRLDGKMWRGPINTSRCVIPATAFGESIGTGGKKRSYLIKSDSAVLLGGLYRHYDTSRGPVTGMAVITCSPHSRLSQYHDKACPLFLPHDTDFIKQWLDPNVGVTKAMLDVIKQPLLTTGFTVVPVKTTRNHTQVAPVERLEAD